jgi:hypothetical protein
MVYGYAHHGAHRGRDRAPPIVLHARWGKLQRLRKAAALGQQPAGWAANETVHVGQRLTCVVPGEG